MILNLSVYTPSYAKHTHTHTHTEQEIIPALQLQTFKSTTMCCCCVFAVQRASKVAAAESVQGGGGRRVDWWEPVAHTGRGAQVLTCNYGPFIGHNVNYTGEEQHGRTMQRAA